MARPPRSCDRLDDDHMTAVVHHRWGELVPMVVVHGGLAIRPDEAGKMPAKTCDEAKKN